MADSSSPPQNPEYLAVSLPPPVLISASVSRRLPPPCWSHDETVALIDAYREKWYSLRRGNLRACHWQEVADTVAHRCPVSGSSPKTSVQCRHKMEKLRKRYRTELQRSRGNGSASSWVLFRRMHLMEKGPGSVDSASDASDDDDEDDDNLNDNEDDDDLYEDVRGRQNLGSNRSGNPSMGNGVGNRGNRQSPFRIRLPSKLPSNSILPRAKIPENPSSYLGPKVPREFTAPRGSERRTMKRERECDAVAEMVSAIKFLGDGFVKMEQMKLEMTREIETMRMEMEIKRTEMVLESQQRIVEAIAKGFAEKRKKTKRAPSPAS